MLPHRAAASAGLLALLLLTAACASDDPPPADPTPVADAGPAAPAPEAAPPPASRSDPVTAPSGPLPTAERDGEGLGLSEAELVRVFAESELDPAAFEAVQLGDGRRVMAASYPPSTQRQVLWVAMFGGAQTPHTVRVDYFPTNAQAGETETVGMALAGLMTALFPDWSEAPRWPEAAGNRAWQEAVKAAEEGPAEGGGARVPILEGERDGVWLAALGVPPNVVSYVFTTREPCRPSVAAATFYKGYVGCS